MKERSVVSRTLHLHIRSVDGFLGEAIAITFEVAVKRAKSKEEMMEPVQQPEKTSEKLPWAEIARRSVE